MDLTMNSRTNPTPNSLPNRNDSASETVKMVGSIRGKDSLYKLYCRQTLTACTPLIGVAVAGLASGYSAVLLPQLKSPGSFDANGILSNGTGEIRVTTSAEESWIASAAVLPMAPGCWMSGLLMEKLGRRKSIMVIFPLFIVSWLIIALANTFGWLIAGRLLSGLCAGLQAPLAPVYISETSDPRLRGILTGAISLALCIGILIVHIMGTWLDWRTTAYMCAVSPCLALLICLVARESPIWLLNKSRIEEARSTWIYLRGERSLEEYFVLENLKVSATKINQKKRSFVVSLKKTLTTRYFLLPLGILCLFFFTAQFAGTNVIIFYSVDMLADVAGQENAYLGSLITDVVRVTFCAIACVLVKKYNRRALTFVSGFGVAAVLILLSLCLYFEFGKPWVSVTLLMIYTALLPLGLIPLPWMLCGELFPRKYRGFGSGFTSGFTFICFFVVVKMAPGMFETLHPYGTFAIYGGITLLGTTLLYFTLPETKDKTLHEIERSFDKKTLRSEKQTNIVESEASLSLAKPVSTGDATIRVSYN